MGITRNIKAIEPQRTRNWELVEDCRQLGYVTGKVLDPTYGLGGMWPDFKRADIPTWLTTADIHPHLGVHTEDFTNSSWEDESFDSIVFDPPYKLNGTSTGKGVASSDQRYGVADSVSWQDRHALIRQGITEQHRILKPGGHLLVKCQDQVCSGRVRWQTHDFASHAEWLGMRLVDSLLLQGYRAQPPNRKQVHARRNYSTMLVLLKP